MRVSAFAAGLLGLIVAAAPAMAGEGASLSDEAPRYRVLEADVSIPATQSVNGYEIIDANTILLRVGANRLYAAELSGSCGRAARLNWNIGVETFGGGRIDRDARIVVDGRRCAIQSLSRVELIPEDPASAEAGSEG